jgi:hypothetical protein
VVSGTASQTATPEGTRRSQPHREGAAGIGVLSAFLRAVCPTDTASVQSAVMSHPISLTVSDDLRRNRLTVAFRLILAIPHLIWVSVWGLVVVLAVILSWFATLFRGETPEGLHNFIAQFLRYSTQLQGYLLFLADPYPGFLGDREYPADLVVAPPAPQNRWKTAFRLILAIPAHIVNTILTYLMFVVAVISWFVCLFTGTMPLGLRNLTAWVVRFGAQTNGYLYLLTDRYPSFSTETTE